jgi:hypothetical protein
MVSNDVVQTRPLAHQSAAAMAMVAVFERAAAANAAEADISRHMNFLHFCLTDSMADCFIAEIRCCIHLGVGLPDEV